MKKLMIVILLAGAGSASAAFPDGTVWSVASKTCAGRAVAVAGAERVQFAGGIFAHIFLSSQDLTQYCNKAQVSMRMVQFGTNGTEGYVESGLLRSSRERTVCRSLEGNTVLSDTSAPFNSVSRSYSLSLGEDKGFLEIDGAAECSDGLLRFELNKK